MHRCDYRRTTVTYGPRGGLNFKKWRCSRKGVLGFYDQGVKKLCSQHFKCACAAADKDNQPVVIVPLDKIKGLKK